MLPPLTVHAGATTSLPSCRRAFDEREADEAEESPSAVPHHG